MSRTNFFVRGEDDILNSLGTSGSNQEFEFFDLSLTPTSTSSVTFFYRLLGNSEVEFYLRGDFVPSTTTNVVRTPTNSPIPFEILPLDSKNIPVAFFATPGLMEIENTGRVNFFIARDTLSDFQQSTIYTLRTPIIKYKKF